MAKAKLIESTEKFVAVLERSQLFGEKQLEAIKKHAETSEDPLPIARSLVKNGWLTKWQASQLLSGFYNLTLGKYRLVEYLGKGELGNVYLAENPKLGRKVALKTLSKQGTQTPELVKRFLDEASAAAALDHRNIVHVHDVSSEDNRHYVVMEYVSGQNLQTRVDANGHLAFADAASFIRQAAEGLQYAHQQGVIHRDIKPANIMVDDGGIAKILDIGVGHLRQQANDPTDDTGDLMMSASAYMAPEHARGQEIDARSDIYSLGGVFYFLLTGRAPFSIKTDAERTKVKESKQPVPLSDLRADTPQPLIDVCERMLALEPDSRYESMADVLAAIPDDDTEFAGTAAPAAFNLDLGEGAKPAVAAAAADFTINTKRRKKKKRAKKAEPEQEPAEQQTDALEAAAPEPAAAEQTEPVATEPAELETAQLEEAEPESIETAEGHDEATATSDKPAPAASEQPKKGLSKRLIIGGACAAGLLLLLLGVGIGALLLTIGRGEPEVAQMPTPAPDLGDSTSVDVTDEATAELSDDAADDSTDESSEDSSTAPSTTPEPAVESSPANAADGPSDAAASVEDVEQAKPAEPQVSTDGKAPPAETPSEPTSAVTEDVAAKPQPQEPKKTSATKTEAPKAAKPEPAKKKPAKKPPAKKAPPKPKVFVFKPAVDLPTPAADAPELTLGRINIRLEDEVYISLSGGGTAATGRTEFSLQNARDGVAPRDWEFYLSDGSSDPVVIATMSMPEQELKFKWTSAGVEKATATNLRNCSLKITAGADQPQDLALRTPRKVPPSKVDLERSATIKLPLEGAPDRNSLKLQVTVKGHKSLVEPAHVELGKGGRAMIYFGENQDQAALALKIDASLNARGVQIKTDPHFIVSAADGPIRLNKSALKQFDALPAEQQRLQSRVFEGQKAASNKKLPPPEKARINGLLSQIKARLQLIDKAVAKLTQLRTDMPAVAANASLQFRVFSDTFDKQIDLIVTDSKAAPVEP